MIIRIVSHLFRNYSEIAFRLIRDRFGIVVGSGLFLSLDSDRFKGISANSRQNSLVTMAYLANRRTSGPSLGGGGERDVFDHSVVVKDFALQTVFPVKREFDRRRKDSKTRKKNKKKKR